MIVIGIVLLIIGAKVGFVWTTGVVLVLLGLVALLLGLTGHRVGRRRHYF